MKKLLSLVAVLALVLAMAPVATVNAATTFYDVASAWQKIGSVWYFVVNYKMLNAPSSGTVELITSDGSTVLATAALGQPLAVSWADAVTNFNYARTGLKLRVGTDVSSTFYMSFYTFTTDLATSYKSGDYVTFTGEIKLVTGDAFGAGTDLASVPVPTKVKLLDGSGGEIAAVDVTPKANTGSTAYTFTVEDVRLTGYAGALGSWLTVGIYSGSVNLYNHYVKFNRANLQFNPAVTAVTGSPTFVVDLQVSDHNGEVLPTGNATITFNGKDYNATIYSWYGTTRITAVLDTPTVAKTYTATVVTQVTSPAKVDGIGTFSIVLGTGLVLGDLNMYADDDTYYYIPFFFAEGAGQIGKAYVTVEDPEGILYYDDYGNYYWVTDVDHDEISPETVYADGIYCTEDDAYAAVADQYYEINSNTGYVKVMPFQGGTIKVTVKAKVGTRWYTATKEYAVSGYKVVGVVTDPASPVYGTETKVTVQVTKSDGKTAVNNAVVWVIGSVTASVDGSVANVNNGLYTLKLPKTVEAGWFDVKVTKADGTVMAYVPGAFAVGRAATLSVALNKTVVNAGLNETITATVTDSKGNLVDVTEVRLGTKSVPFTVLSTGRIRFNVDDLPVSKAGTYTITVRSYGKYQGSATFEVKLPITVKYPTDGFVNAYAADKITVSVPEDYDVSLVGVKPTEVYVVKDGAEPTATDSVKWISAPSIAAKSDYEITYGFAGTPKADCAKVVVLYNDKWEVASFTLNKDIKMSIVRTATWYVGDAPSVQAKVVDAHGNPIKNVVVEMAYGGVVTMSAKTNADGIADFGVMALNLPGIVVMKANVNGLALEDKAIVFATKPEPVYTTKIVLTVGLDIYTLNGQIKFWDAAPYIKNGRTMVPLRALAEALGFQVGWDGATKTVSIWKPDQNPSVDTPYIMLQIGTTTAKVGSALYELDVAAEIVNNRTMVPLRFVSERLGYTVQWTPPSTVTLVKP